MSLGLVEGDDDTRLFSPWDQTEMNANLGRATVSIAASLSSDAVECKGIIWTGREIIMRDAQHELPTDPEYDAQLWLVVEKLDV